MPGLDEPIAEGGGMKHPSLPEAGTMPLGSAFLLLLFVRPPPDCWGSEPADRDTLSMPAVPAEPVRFL